VDVAIRRWEALTGKLSVLEGDGRGFAAISEERLPASENAPDNAGAQRAKSGRR